MDNSAHSAPPLHVVQKMEEDITTISVVPSAPFLEKEALDEYVTKYRREDVTGLEVSKLLDLFPAHPMTTEFQKELTWEDPWPFGTRSGVYIVYDASMRLIYIGKASVIGNRLAAYFGGGSECIFRQEWGIPPRFLRIIGVPTDMRFEAAGLEAFLIARLHPELNTQGKY